MVVKNRLDRPMVVCYEPGDVPMVEDPDNPGTMIPDETWLITQDDTPVDGKYTERGMRLLTNPLYANWKGPAGDDAYVAVANVGLFFDPVKPPIVPDVMLSVGVTEPTPIRGQIVQSYFVWRYKKLPEIVVEIVSNRKGGEATRKRKSKSYAQIGIRWYVIWDPEEILSVEILQVYKLRRGVLQPTNERFFPEVGLGLTLWEGDFQKRHTDRWLRWCDKNGKVIPTGEETAQVERARVKQLKRRADKLAAKLRTLGVDPDADEI